MAEGTTRTRLARATRRSALVLLVALAVPVSPFADSDAGPKGGSSTCQEAAAAPTLPEIEERVRRAALEAQRDATGSKGPVVLNGRGYNYRPAWPRPPGGSDVSASHP